MINLIKEIFNDKNIVSITIANKRKKTYETSKIIIRPVLIKDELCYQWEEHKNNQVFHKNLLEEETMAAIISQMKNNFKQCNIFTEEKEIQILANKYDKPKIITKQNQGKTLKGPVTHNKQKNYIIPEGLPCDFLVKLGVMDESGKVYQKHYSKFRQINRFLEIVQDVYPKLPEGTVKIIDFGCGKAYLTFALYHYLKRIQKRQVEIIGLDLKKDVISFCNNIAKELNYNELKFELGDIAKYEDTSCNLVVTLHACDTATDYALINAVKWNTDVILSVPCCQHELFKQIKNQINNPILKYGINKDKFTELLTNSLRGLKLEEAGYGVSMVEFTSLEHTSKNILIRAVKNSKSTIATRQKARSEYDALLEEYCVNPTIDQMEI
ncbi:MAG: SAM-dependent methyltransferase [Anaerovoracaceae bacterium]